MAALLDFSGSCDFVDAGWFPGYLLLLPQSLLPRLSHRIRPGCSVGHGAATNIAARHRFP